MEWEEVSYLLGLLVLGWACVFLVMWGTIRKGYKGFLVTTTSLVVIAGLTVTGNAMTGNDAHPFTTCNFPDDLGDFVFGEECGDGYPTRMHDGQVVRRNDLARQLRQQSRRNHMGPG